MRRTGQRWRAAAVPLASTALAAVLGIVALTHRPGPAASADVARHAPVAAAPPDPSRLNVPGHRLGSAPATRSGLVFADEFDGPANTPATAWLPQVGGSGWGNGELQCDTADPANDTLDGQGHLVLTAFHEPGYRCADGHVNDYSSARVITAATATGTHGSIRVRALLPTGSGAWPAIWALGADHDAVGWPASGEIDIAEAVGTTPDTVYQTVHGPGRDGGAYSLGTDYRIGRPLAAGFHTYGVDWSTGQVQFSMDGVVYARFSRAEVERRGAWVFDKPFRLLLDVAVGGSFPGPPDAAAVFPQRMLIDYVRVYG